MNPLRVLAVFTDPRRAEHYEALKRVAERIALSDRWYRLYHSNAFTLWSTHPLSSALEKLARRHTLVIGSLFSKGHEPSGTKSVRLSDASIERLAHSPEELITQYWGDYLCFNHDAKHHLTQILKDPTGSLSCYLASLGPLLIGFTHVEDAKAIGVPRFTIRSSRLMDRLLNGGLDQRHSALNEVHALHRGFALTIDHHGPHIASEICVWRPEDFTRAEVAIEDVPNAAAALHETIHRCTRTLTEDAQTALLRVSGGLDSSIIAACAKATEPEHLVAYTYCDRDAARTEEPWARALTTHLQLQHFLHAFSGASLRLSDLESLRATIEPFSTLHYLIAAPIERQLCDQHGLQAVLTGQGGDSIFGGDAIALAASEHFARHGPSARFFQLVAQIAHLTGRAYASVAYRSLRRVVRGGRMRDLRSALFEGSTLLHASLIERSAIEYETYPHPWFAGQTRVPWSTIRRLGELVFLPHEPWPDVPSDQLSPAIISPLYAQPVVELCLRIPLDLHLFDGRERGLARRAFETDLPSIIVNRVWKDRAPGMLERLIVRNRDYLRERLLDGYLVHERLLDRARIERALSLTPSAQPTLPGELLQHLDTELWARHWIA